MTFQRISECLIEDFCQLHFLSLNRFLLQGVLISAVAVTGGSLSLYVGNVGAGRLLHVRLLRNSLASPLMFFDTTPVGRILNRFSKDIDVVDSTIAQNFHVWLACFLRVLTIPVVIGYSTPLFIPLVVPLGILYIVVQVRMYSRRKHFKLKCIRAIQSKLENVIASVLVRILTLLLVNAVISHKES